MNTLRNELICAALTGLCSHSAAQIANPDHIATAAIEIADATLAKLNASESPITMSAEVAWSQAPEWAMWHAWDEDGKAYWFRSKPEWDGAMWGAAVKGYDYATSHIPKPANLAAHDSLTRRPGK